jgi:hypothetical protein
LFQEQELAHNDSRYFSQICPSMPEKNFLIDDKSEDGRRYFKYSASQVGQCICRQGVIH